MNEEAELLGALLPSSPDYAPIIQAVREKYNLPEISPDDDPITEVYLGDEIVPIEEFRQDIRNRILENLEKIMSKSFFEKYQSTKKIVDADYQSELAKYTDEQKLEIEPIFEYAKKSSQATFQILDIQIENIVNMICLYLFTGETQSAPDEWFSQVMATTNSGESTIIALVGELTNLDLMFKEIRALHRKTFGPKRVKLTAKTAGAGYYMQLRRLGKKWDFIVEEYIKRNKFSLPSDKTSKRYNEILQKHSKTLRKRIERSEKILSLLVK